MRTRKCGTVFWSVWKDFPNKREKCHCFGLRIYSWEDRCLSGRQPPHKNNAMRRAIYILNTLAGRASAKRIEWHDMLCVILFIMRPLQRKLLRALPYWACGRWGQRPSQLFPALIDSPCSQSRRLQRLFFALYNYVIFSVRRRSKLLLRRFETSQM